MQAYLILTVPYKTLNKRLQTAQKHIVPETSHILMVVAELAKVFSGCPTGDSMVSLLEGTWEKLSPQEKGGGVHSGEG